MDGIEALQAAASASDMEIVKVREGAQAHSWGVKDAKGRWRLYSVSLERVAKFFLARAASGARVVRPDLEV